MFFLTYRERKVLIAIVVLILAGTLVRHMRASKAKAEILPDFSSRKSSSLININNASVQELCGVKGIGRVTAKRIADYRDKFGRFKTAEDLKKVKGIGESKAKIIAKQACFE